MIELNSHIIKHESNQSNVLKGKTQDCDHEHGVAQTS